MFVNDLCVGILPQCNWCCDYCIAYNNKNKIDEDKIFKELYPIRNKLKNLWLSGGEPGLLSEKFWEKLLKSIDFNLKICTNGTFISNGLYDSFEKRINNVMIHCVRELNDEINPIVLSTYIKNNQKMDINIVIHKYNVDKINFFLKKYKEIDFTLHFADKSFQNFISTEYDYCIDKKSAIKLINELKNIKNIKNKIHIDRLTKSIIKNNFNNLNIWSYKNIEVN